MQYEEEMQYLTMISEVADFGDKKDDRTGVGTYASFGRQIRYDLFNRRLPIVTTRKIKPMDPIIEMLWFIAGDTDIEFLKNHKINIWDSWVREDTKRFDAEGKLIGGSIGPGAYGAQWRRWEDTRIINISDWKKYEAFGYKYVTSLTEHQYPNGTGKCVISRSIDQLAQAIEMIKKSPDSRRILVTAWNPGRFEDQALLPCHSLFQFYTADMSEEDSLLMFHWMYASDLTERDYLTTEQRAKCDSVLKPLIDIQGFKKHGFSASIKMELFKHEFRDYGPSKEVVFNLIKELGLPTKSLSLQLYCRSQDSAVGTTYNTLQYAALAHMVAQVTNTWAKEFIWVGGDVHIYQNQIDVFKEQFKRDPLDKDITFNINPAIKDIDAFTPEDFSVTGYEHHPFLKYPIAV